MSSSSSVTSVSSSSAPTILMTNLPFTLESYPGFIVKGDTKQYTGYFRKLGGSWIPSIKAWLFDDLFRASVVDLQRRASIGELPVLEETVPTATTRHSSSVKSKHWRDDVKPDGTRTGKAWSSEEKEALMVALVAGQSFAEIALDHKRSESAVSGRVMTLISELYKDECKSLDEIVELTGRSVDLVAEVMKFGPRGDWRNRRTASASAHSLMPAQLDLHEPSL